MISEIYIFFSLLFRKSTFLVKNDFLIKKGHFLEKILVPRAIERRVSSQIHSKLTHESKKHTFINNK